MKNISLSFQDLFLLAFEREDLAFNSHFYFEAQSLIDFSKYKETFLKYIKSEPQLQLSCDYKSGKVTHHLLSDDEILKACVILNSPEEEEKFLESHFKYLVDPPVKLALYQNTLIFSFHHPFFDGYAQMVFLKDFFDLYHQRPYEPRQLSMIIKFRKYFNNVSPLWYLKYALSILFQFKKSRDSHTKISRLFDQEPISRKMSYVLLEYDKKKIDLALRKLKYSSTVFYSFCAVKAFDKIQRERGDIDNPIVVYIPKILRSELKAQNAFQNLIGFIWMKISRHKISAPDFNTYFRDFYKFRSSPNEVRKVLFWAGILTKLSSYQKLRRILEKKERKLHDSSLLISSGRTPQDIQLPDELINAKFYGRGVMHRSPGIGLLITGNSGHDYLCIEYLKEALNLNTIEQFKKLLDEEIKSYISDP